MFKYLLQLHTAPALIKCFPLMTRHVEEIIIIRESISSIHCVTCSGPESYMSKCVHGCIYKRTQMRLLTDLLCYLDMHLHMHMHAHVHTYRDIYRHIRVHVHVHVHHNTQM
jgi:hypothetical protein